MSENVIRSDEADRRRFWAWLVAALVALAFLFGVMRWAARQVTPPAPSRASDRIAAGVEWVEPDSGQEGVCL